MTREGRVSEEFWDAVIHAGSNVIDCGLCGRTHFVEDSMSSYEEGELEKLHALSEENPDRTIFHANADSVSWGSIDGKQVVYGCPCNGAAKYETLFWESRRIISQYFSARAEKMKKLADEAAGLAKKVKEATAEEH